MIHIIQSFLKRLTVGASIATFVLLAGAGSTQPAYAADPTDAAKSSVCSGVSGQLNGSCGSGGANIQKIVKTVVNVLSIVGGVVAVVMIIVGGLKYITSGGDAQAVSGAKKTILGAIIGLIIISFAQFIVRFVLKNV